MSKIFKAFDHGKAFIGFVTGGDPTNEKTAEFILEMVRAGADLIEIGIPFSDPIAEGIVIQEANLRSLSHGTTPDELFEVVKQVRKSSDIPICFMTYLNPVFNYGYDKFCAKCMEYGVDGIIVPDMPYEEKNELSDVASKYDVDVISLVAPTSEERVKTIASDSKGFLYVVSSMGVTGIRSEINTDLGAIMEMVRQSTDVPAAIGFGINTPEQAKKYAQISDGIIIGSAIVKLIAKYGENASPYIYDYVKSIKDAISE